MAFTILPAPPTRATIHFHGFTLYSDPGAVVSHPAPSRLLYNYDPLTSDFFDFDPSPTSVFTVDIVDAGNPLLSSYQFTDPDTEEDISTPTLPFPASIRLKFTNIGTVRYHLSDWILMYA